MIHFNLRELSDTMLDALQLGIDNEMRRLGADKQLVITEKLRRAGGPNQMVFEDLDD